MSKQNQQSDTAAARLASSNPDSDLSAAARPGHGLASGPSASGLTSTRAPAAPAMGGEGVNGGAVAGKSNGLGGENSTGKEGSLRDASLQNFTAPKEGSGPSLAFDTKEKNLRRGFGLSEDAIRELRQRHLVQGVDWEMVKRAVCYSRRGMETLRAAIAEGSQKNAAAPPAPATAQLEPVKEVEPVTLIVWKAKVPNRRQILAYMPGADADNRPEARFRVIVRHPDKFIKGMEIPCRPLDGSGTLYELACTEPRRKGRLPQYTA